MAGLGPLFEEKWKPTKEMSKQEMVEEIEKWRNLWTWVNEDVKYFLTKIGMQCRIIKGNFQGVLGELLQPKFKLDKLEVGVKDKVYDQVVGKYMLETKVIQFDANRLIDLEFVSERKLFDETTDWDLAQILGTREEEQPNVSNEDEG